MNSKNLLRIISIVMSVCVVLAVGGCKNKDNTSDDSGTTTQQIVEGKGNAVQPTVDEDTSSVIIKYTTVNSEGKEEDATTVVTVNSPIVNTITMGSTLSESYKTDDQKTSFVEKEVSNGNIEKDKAEEIINASEQWVEFGYTAYVANTSSQRLIAKFIEIGGSNDNIVLNKNLDCEYSISPGSAYEVYITGFVNIEKYPDEETLISELNKMNVQLVYTLADNATTDIDDWDEVTTKKMDVSFG